MIYSALGTFTLNSESIVFLGERENNKNCNTSFLLPTVGTQRSSQIKMSDFESASYNVAENLLIKHRKRKNKAFVLINGN